MDTLEAELARFETELARFEQPDSGAFEKQQQAPAPNPRNAPQPRVPPPQLPPPNTGGGRPPPAHGNDQNPVPRMLPPPPVMGPPPMQQGRPPPPPRRGPPPPHAMPMAPPIMRPPINNPPPGPILGPAPPPPPRGSSHVGAGPSYRYGGDFYGYQQEPVPGYSAGPSYPPGPQQQGPAPAPQPTEHQEPNNGGGKKAKEGGAKKKKAIARRAAGEKWFDPTLSEWDENDFRIFVGDLGNEVNDDILTKAFSKYPTFIKAKVIRDKRTNKTRGYGFVSVGDGNDFAKVMKEMQGKYIGNRPCKLRKSTWKDRSDPDPKRKYKEKPQKGNANKRQRGVLHK